MSAKRKLTWFAGLTALAGLHVLAYAMWQCWPAREQTALLTVALGWGFVWAVVGAAL
jgi:hypothetical protein